MTAGQFAVVMSTLAMQLRATDVDEATIRAYYMALKDLELEFLALAATRMAQQGGSATGDSRHWFPKTSEWRALAGTIEGERTLALQAVLRKLPTPLCLVCNDTGWEQVTDHNNPRWKHCACRKLRRLEILGRRPMPQLPEHAGA